MLRVLLRFGDVLLEIQRFCLQSLLGLGDIRLETRSLLFQSLSSLGPETPSSRLGASYSKTLRDSMKFALGIEEMFETSAFVYDYWVRIPCGFSRPCRDAKQRRNRSIALDGMVAVC